ncbi:MAG: arginase family protein [Rhodobacteraceae bacterium]|nr:arginase family protein [Paracoccaceae bacterium]
MARLQDMYGGGSGETFLGLPRCPDPGRLEARIALIGAGTATPYAGVGAYCMEAPAAIRAAAAPYSANLGHVNFDLGGPVLPEGVAAVDAGDLPQDPADPEGNRARIFGAVGRILDRGGVPVLLGGDDSVPIPMIEAYGGRGRRHTILQIDAHIDWRDEVLGERLGLSSTMRRASEMAHVGPMVQVGQRGIGSARPADHADALARGVRFVPASEVARNGILGAADAVEAGAEVIVVLDVDALDPAIMPAAIGRTPGGLGYWQVLDLVAAVGRKARIAGFAMTEFMPGRDIDGTGALTAAALVAAVIGLIARNEG